MRKFWIGYAVVCACVAWVVYAQEANVSRNAFIEVIPPPGQKVKWISADDFILVGERRADGGAEQVTIRVRRGWKLTEPKDGVMTLAPGQMASYTVRGELGENGGGGDGHVCDSSNRVEEIHISAPVISATLSVDNPIWKLSTSDTVSVPVSGRVSVDEPGKHDIITTVVPCTICGAPQGSVTTNRADITPTSFLWNWTLGDTNGCVTGASFSETVEISSSGLLPFTASVITTNIVSCCAVQTEAEGEVDIRLVTVTPDKTNLALLRGESDTITFTVSPTNAPVTFSASMDSTNLSASVSGNIVTIQNLIDPLDPVAHGDEGMVTITYSIGSGNATASAPQGIQQAMGTVHIQATNATQQEQTQAFDVLGNVEKDKTILGWWSAKVFDDWIDVERIARRVGLRQAARQHNNELIYRGVDPLVAQFYTSFYLSTLANTIDDMFQNKQYNVTNGRIRESRTYKVSGSVSLSTSGGILDVSSDLFSSFISAFNTFKTSSSCEIIGIAGGSVEISILGANWHASVGAWIKHTNEFGSLTITSVATIAIRF